MRHPALHLVTCHPCAIPNSVDSIGACLPACLPACLVVVVVGFTSHKPHQGLPHEGGMRAQSIARPGQPLWLNHGQAGKGWGGTVGRQKGTAHRRPHTS